MGNKGLGMRLALCGPRMLMEQRQILSPPMIDGVEALVEQAHARVKSGKSDRSHVSYVNQVVSREDGSSPYTDIQIANMASKSGYNISRRDVALARRELGIASYQQRKK